MRASLSYLVQTFTEQDEDLAAGDPLGFEGYREELGLARARSAHNESCIWGWADIDGVQCALVVLDFTFLGGSMGVAAGEKIARAFDAARRRKLPIVTVCATGGARMQEGMVALAQMAKTVEARRGHANAGLVHVSVLSSPTTGGVYASFASLADVVIAEPGATIGFAGPRVVEELTGTRPPADSHKAEFAYEHGLVDAIVPRAEQPLVLGRILRSTSPRRATSSGRHPTRVTPSPTVERTAWERLQLARDPDRPKARGLLVALLDDAFELRGDRTGAPDDEHVVVRTGGLWGTSHNVVAVGQDAGAGGRIRPEGFRKAIRGVELAGRIGLPVLTIIDTRGADPLPASEGGGIAVSIARTLQAMLDCPTPTLAVVTGEGGSGGALAMAVADCVLALENTVFSVIAPEGAASILHLDPSDAPGLAERMRITPHELVELGFVDGIVPEPPGGAHTDPQATGAELGARIGEELSRLVAMRTRRRVGLRRRRWREAGNRFLEQALP
jgi:acetyl-CoA carboxylase carboxyl transferase subunit beta